MRKITLLLTALSLSMVISAAHAEPEAGLSNLLSGTWAVINETADFTYSGTRAIGQVTFFNDHMTIDSGGLAAAGIVAAAISEETGCFIPLDPISFKFVGEGVRAVMYVSWVDLFSFDGSTFPADAMITIIKFDGNRMTMVGQGGCGTGIPRISYLERIQ